MLTKKHRINKKLFKEIHKKGKSFSFNCFHVKKFFLPNKNNVFAFVVSSKNIKRAVDRNKLKRRARHIVKKILPKIEKGLSAIIFFKKGAEKKTFLELEKEINDIFCF
jgi:ribonuclease P protein component